MLKRVAAGLAGALTLFSGVTVTLGIVLAAPLGVLAARAVARRRHRPLSRGAAWLGAVIASFVATGIAIGFLFAVTPAATRASVRAAMDSAQAQQKPTQVPKWLERMNPSAERQSAMTDKLTRTTAFTLFATIMGLMVACSMVGTLAGSLGWVAAMFFAYAFAGRWLPSGDRLPSAFPIDG